MADIARGLGWGWWQFKLIHLKVRYFLPRQLNLHITRIQITTALPPTVSCAYACTYFGVVELPLSVTLSPHKS
jgi:hypothetical protein